MFAGIISLNSFEFLKSFFHLLKKKKKKLMPGEKSSVAVFLVVFFGQDNFFCFHMALKASVQTPGRYHSNK